MGYCFHQSEEQKVFIAQTFVFLLREIILKKISKRKVELNKVLVP